MRCLLVFIALAFTSITYSQSDSLMAMPTDSLVYMMVNCDGVEMTFFESGKSVSFFDNQQARKAFSFFTINPATVKADKADAYIMFLVKGDFYAEGRVYYLSEKEYIEIKRNNRTYYHLLSEAGIKFFSQFISK